MPRHRVEHTSVLASRAVCIATQSRRCRQTVGPRPLVTPVPNVVVLKSDSFGWAKA